LQLKKVTYKFINYILTILTGGLGREPEKLDQKNF